MGVPNLGLERSRTSAAIGRSSTPPPVRRAVDAATSATACPTRPYPRNPTPTVADAAATAVSAGVSTSITDTRPPSATEVFSNKRPTPRDARSALAGVCANPTHGNAAREVDDRGNEDYCRLRRNRPRVIFPGIGQELAPWRLPPGCCGFFGPVPSATRDKACSTCRQSAQY